MTSTGSDVVIVGGGIAGLGTAYFLALHGVSSTVIERDSVGSHASGFAYGGLSPLSGASYPGPIFPLAQLGIRLHTELGKSLPEETGVNTEFRARPSLSIAFDQREADAMSSVLALQGKIPQFNVSWLDAKGLREVDERINPEALGGVYIEGTADVDAYKLVLALTEAVENRGVTVRHGTVTGLKRKRGRVTAVQTESGEIPCETVVLAIGPWSGQASGWLGTKIAVGPLKGQILRLRAQGAPFLCSIGWAGQYASTKPDGLIWTGTTEEHAGFDESRTTEARDYIMSTLLKMIPCLTDAELVRQTACLRPVADDGMPVLGEVPGWRGVHMITGGGRSGILLGPGMASTLADLIATGETGIDISSIGPGRFSS